MYVYDTHHWGILWSSYRKLAWVGFEPTTTEFRSDAVTYWAIRPWVQLTLRASFLELLQFHRIYIIIYIYIYTSSVVCGWHSDDYELWRLGIVYGLIYMSRSQTSENVSADSNPDRRVSEFVMVRFSYNTIAWK